MPKKVRETPSNRNNLKVIKALAKIVTTLGTFDVTLTDKTTGQNLLDDIAKAVGLEETWWFGLLHK